MTGPVVPGQTVTVIGVGNPYRHDDAAGLIVIDRLRERFGGDSRVRLLDLDGEPVRIIQAWEGSTAVLIVDAVRSVHPAGTVHHFEADHLTGVAAEGVELGGGHLLGLGEAIDLARALGELPPVLEVVGIEGDSFELGEGVSDAVALACDSVVEHLDRRLRGLLADSGE